MRDQFLLDSDVVFLNHGSFGACPVPVFETYQQWQRELERQPVAFFSYRIHSLLDEARAVLADYVHADPDDLVYVTNATTGINIVARSLNLQPGDEVLTTDHEYGAVDFTWEYVCDKTGATLVRQSIPLSVVGDAQAFVDLLWQGVTPNTRVIALSHITSPTALIFPVEAVCQQARAEGILTVIDGAHVPGQLDLDLSRIDADFYTGNCHKWMCAPKGAGFLYTRREHHAMVEPVVISWGWGRGESYVDHLQWSGTDDPAAFLSVPAAIDFMREYDWPTLRQGCHDLAVATRDRIADLTGLPVSLPDHIFAQMIAVPVPPMTTDQLFYDYHVVAPVINWNDQTLLRLSFQVYNTAADTDALLAALHAILR